MIIGLNPSATEDNATISRCINFARTWGYGGVHVLNLFAYRATQPSEMMRAQEPVGPDNDKWLRKVGKKAGIIVAAWGNDGAFKGRSQVVRTLFPSIHCIKMNKSGEPAHPLYLKANLKPVPLV